MHFFEEITLSSIRTPQVVIMFGVWSFWQAHRLLVGYQLARLGISSLVSRLLFADCMLFLLFN